MDASGLNLEGLNHEPRCRNEDYSHKNQLEFYGSEDNQDQFRRRYRFRKETVRLLTELVHDDIALKSLTNHAFTAEQKMCIALRYFATGTFQRQVGDSEGASQSSLHRIIHKVAESLASHADTVIKFSTDPQILKQVSDGFYAFRGKFPNCVGAIDGTHVPIIAPWVNPEQYYTYKKNFAINVQLVVNHRGAITHLSCQWPGSVHDSRVLSESFMQDVLDSNVLGQYYLLGDTGYSCQYNLLTPYPNYPVKLTEEEKYYNKALSRTRVKVECVIRQLKNKFSCLQTTSHYQPETVSLIIKACCFLWNFGLLTGDNKGYDPDQYVPDEHDKLNRKLLHAVENDRDSGLARREILKKYLWKHQRQN